MEIQNCATGEPVSKSRVNHILGGMLITRTVCWEEILLIHAACDYADTIQRDISTLIDSEVVLSYYDTGNCCESPGEIVRLAFAVNAGHIVLMHRQELDLKQYSWKCYIIPRVKKIDQKSVDEMEVIDIKESELGLVLFELFKKLMQPGGIFDVAQKTRTYLLEFESVWASLVEVYPSAETIRKSTNKY